MILLNDSRNLISLLFIMLFLSPPHTLQAKDKRTPLHIVPQGKQLFQLVLQDKEVTSIQYRNDGVQVSETENRAVVSKTIYRTTYFKDVEFCLELPYILDRTQKSHIPNGTTPYKYDGSGIGDINLAVTYQWFDSRQEKLGLISGVEVKLATGDENKGIGSDSYDFVFRSTLSYKSEVGFPYLMAIYTLAGDGQINGVTTNEGDDLYLATGLKTRLWRKFGLEARGYCYLRTTDPVKESSGRYVNIEQHNLLGFKLEGRYHFTSKLIGAAFYDSFYSQNHEYRINNSYFKKEPGTGSALGCYIKYIW